MLMMKKLEGISTNIACKGKKNLVFIARQHTFVVRVQQSGAEK